MFTFLCLKTRFSIKIQFVWKKSLYHFILEEFEIEFEVQNCGGPNLSLKNEMNYEIQFKQVFTNKRKEEEEIII